MTDFAKISYYDLKHEERNNRLPQVFGYEKEMARLSRVLSRGLQHNAIITAPSGTGKTTLILGWAKQAAHKPEFFQKKIVMLNAGTLQKIGQLQQSSLIPYQDAFQSLNDCILIIDSFGEMVYQSPAALQNWNTLIKPLFFKDDISVVLSMQPDELDWIAANKSHFLSHFEVIKLEPQSQENQLEILNQAATALGKSFKLESGTTEHILALCRRFPVLGQLPKSAIQLLDEAAAEARSLNSVRRAPSASEGRLLHKALIDRIVAEKTGIPLERLSGDDKTMLKNLPTILNSKIVGQQPALDKMTLVIQRARLGLRSQTKPLGSFLILGPSGVGKTETAKILAQNLYGSEKNFLRIDMSEFGESHASARLLGSPAGYVGFEEGGQLTNHFQNYPYSLLLLDEIEKAHPKVFDIFLQILDDGRITSARGQTVDLTQSIIMATSNLAVQEILDGYKNGQDVHDEDFIKTVIVPKLLNNFRMEFLNRFDAIIIYKPLSADELTDIAFLEIQKIEQRMKEHNIKFEVSRQTLKEKLKALADPRFGARPAKRFIEETCESLITQKLLN